MTDLNVLALAEIAKSKAKAALADQLADAVLAALDIQLKSLGNYAPLPVEKITHLVALARRVKGESDGHQAVPGTD